MNDIFVQSDSAQLEEQIKGMRHLVGCLLTKMGGRVEITQEDVKASAGERWYVENDRLATTAVFRTYK